MQTDLQQHKYMSINRMGHRSTYGMFEAGDPIIITEKIDCSNASFMKDTTGALRVFSRNKELTAEEHLNGFYQWAHANIDPESILFGAVYFGEWLGTPHKVKYEGYEKQFILFDILDSRFDRYFSFTFVKYEARVLSLNLVPVLYEGEYISYEHLESFVGQSKLGAKIGDTETGEGIVVKNYLKQAFAKLVSEAFREVHGSAKAPKEPKLTVESEFVAQTVTPARVEKMFHKLVDERHLPAGLQLEDMGHILKVLTPAVEADILKEERDLLPAEYSEKSLRQSVSKKVPPLIKQYLLESNKCVFDYTEV